MRALPLLLVFACHGHTQDAAPDASSTTPPIDAATGVCLGSSTLATHGLSSDGRVVYDSNQNIYWLADADLAATQTFGVANINSSGSMPYDTAVLWVAAMNGSNYLGHSDWQLATTPGSDSTCSTHNNGDFGRGCTNSAMGSLFSIALGLTYPSTEVAVPSDQIGPFTDVEPSLYWTLDKPGSGSAGNQTFSFSNGQIGANTQFNFLYVWPNVAHAIGTAPAGSGLVAYLGGKAVYDSTTGITWLADANLAATQTFGLTGSGSDGYPLVTSEGGMEIATTATWLAAMNAGSGYLGATDWNLPSYGSDLNTLYGELGFTQGQSVSIAQDCIGPFQNLQPYLYWSCERDGSGTSQSPCSGSAVPLAGYEYSFNFGEGFEGTDLVAKELYVMVYYPGS